MLCKNYIQSLSRPLDVLPVLGQILLRVSKWLQTRLSIACLYPGDTLEEEDEAGHIKEGSGRLPTKKSWRKMLCGNFGRPTAAKVSLMNFDYETPSAFEEMLETFQLNGLLYVSTASFLSPPVSKQVDLPLQPFDIIGFWDEMRTVTPTLAAVAVKCLYGSMNSLLQTDCWTDER